MKFDEPEFDARNIKPNALSCTPKFLNAPTVHVGDLVTAMRTWPPVNDPASIYDIAPAHTGKAALVLAINDGRGLRGTVKEDAPYLFLLIEGTIHVVGAFWPFMIISKERTDNTCD